MRVLLLGGTGVISAAVVRQLAATEAEVTVLVRGSDTGRPVPDGVRVLRADLRDDAAVRTVLGDETFDVAVNFIGYHPDHIAADVARFSGRVGQYVFISTGSVYARPAPRLPVDESSARRAGSFDYPRLKLECEVAVEAAYRDGFPATIVRAAHVYDETVVPVLAGWTVVDRWRRGLPVVVHGDGTSLWNLLHARDFARALCAVLGDERLTGESLHITHDTPLTWDAIHIALARAAGVEPLLVHRSSEDIGREIDWMGPVLTEDFRHSLVYDNSKLHRLAPGLPAATPFARGADEILRWYGADPARQRVNKDVDAAFDRLAGDRRD
ncbi:NAD-dependent epimerase/dehydratase family protein [Streptomyces fuscigenes]|uniref:NAD-dependent epimerase/dehydratase family protein n=1 Tax=Streptomyces fuscigenes TaxID=1528880 RepID=UPI001F23D6A1|nr:NAD-dependent epimerase/dehydratase family protein [Streptomyces fuscigenes]MCF3963398.1 NAD-dependent epimerase/dehydratase family protein [Streptomyces fuscigenes]